MERTTDPDELRGAQSLLRESYGFDPEELAKPPNIVLKDGDNLGLFEYERPGVYSAHYLYRSARGNEARSLALAMLEWMFDNDARVITGLTPLSHKGALRVTRSLGFPPQGTVETFAGPMEIFVCTREQFRNNA